MKYILLIVYLSISFALTANPLDSLRTENVEGKLFIIHQVESKETLFSLSRRYHVLVDEIIKNNPILATTGLKIGDVLRIPYFLKTEVPDNAHIVLQGETLFAISQKYGVEISEIKAINELEGTELSIGQALIIPQKPQATTPLSQKTVQDTAIYHYHIIRQGETLFALSQQYGKEVEELKTWNSLPDNNISIGDSLMVGYTVKTKKIAQTSPPVDRTVANKPVEAIVTEPAVGGSPAQSNPVASTGEGVTITRNVVTNEANYDEIVETGLAELIENSSETRKYLALHRTAKIGTIIRIHNEMNGQEVFVRVLGKLPDTGINDKVLIKISQAAYDRLAAIDKKFRVRISYFPE